jgi:hypothetical protein
MLLRNGWLIGLVSLLAIGGFANAADPPKEGQLPPPKPLLVTVPGEGQLRTNRYAVWQYYGVDRFGRFRPVVVNTSYGGYYLINGECYPWATTYSLEFMKVLVGE